MTDETTQREPDGRFKVGNAVWKGRTDPGGRPAKFDKPEDLGAACAEYFEWVDANPLYEAKAFSNGTTASLPRMRAMTVGGLCLYLNIGEQTWRDYKAKPDFSEVTSFAEQVMRSQKFEGAAAGLLCPNIIARDLGLADKTESKNEHSVSDEASEYMRLAAGTAFGKHRDNKPAV